MRSIAICLLLLISGAVFSQGLNQQDDKGRKQGTWKKTYPGSQQLRYEGQFQDDKPIGVFRYYQPDGKLSAIVEHRGNGVSYSKNFFESGKLTSEGKYIHQKKDSTWTFYGEDGLLLSRENYLADVKSGPQFIYFPDGEVSMEQHYTNGVVNGKVLFFNEKKLPRSVENFINGQREGISIMYNLAGKKLMEGNYKSGLKEGTWTSYNDDGTVRAHYKYTSDKPDTVIRVNGVFEEFYDSQMLKASYTYVNSKKHGPFTEYYEGSWKFEERTDDRSGEKDMYRVPVDHHVKRKGTYFDGQLNGTVEQFDNKGMLQKTQQYKTGKLQP